MSMLQRNARLWAVESIKPAKAALGIRSVAQLLCYEVFLHDLPKKPHGTLDKSA